MASLAPGQVTKLLYLWVFRSASVILAFWTDAKRLRGSNLT